MKAKINITVWVKLTVNGVCYLKEKKSNIKVIKETSKDDLEGYWIKTTLKKLMKTFGPVIMSKKWQYFDTDEICFTNPFV